MELFAYGRIILTSTTDFLAVGGNATLGAAGGSNTSVGLNSGRNQSLDNGRDAERTNGEDSGAIEGGNGGFGGLGGFGGFGQNGGRGGDGGKGGSGAGGTVKVVGSVLTANGAEVDLEGGSAGDPGQDGVLIAGANVFTGPSVLSGFNGRDTASREVASTGPRANSPYLAGAALTPTIAGLDGGADLFGLANPTLTRDDFSVQLAAAPAGAMAAVLRLDFGPASSDYASNYAGFDLVAVINLTGSTKLANPKLGLAQGGADVAALTDLGLGGSALRLHNNPASELAPLKLNNLDPGKVWITLVPSGSAKLSFSMEVGGRSFGLNNATLDNGGVHFVNFTPAAETTPLPGLQAVAVTPDGTLAFAVNAERDALVIINTADGSQRQVFQNGVDGMSGLDAVSDVAVSADGTRAIATSPTQGGVEFRLDAASGVWVLDRMLTASGRGAAVEMRADGSYFVAGSLGVAYRLAGSNANVWANTSSASGTPDGLVLNAAGDRLAVLSASGDSVRLLNAGTGAAIGSALTGAALGLDGPSGGAFSSDGFLYVSASQSHSVSVFEVRSTGLVHRQTLVSGDDGVSGLLGASDVALSADGRFVFVTGAGSNSLAVFSRGSDGLLTPVQTLRNGNSGVSGLLQPAAVAVRGNSVFVASAGSTEGQGGLLDFANVVGAGELPQPRREQVEFSHLESLRVLLGGGDDALNLRASPVQGGSFISVTVEPGAGNDQVLLSDLGTGVGVSTLVDLGPGNDSLRISTTRANAALKVDAGPGADTLTLDSTGTGNTLELLLGDGADAARVSGSGLGSGTQVQLRGEGSDNAADTLFFDPQISAGARVVIRDRAGIDVIVPDPEQGSLQRFRSAVDTVGNGVVNYSGFNGVSVDSAPQVVASVAAIFEGGSATFNANVALLRAGSSIPDPLAWDLDGDGQFDDAFGTSVTLTWAQLRDLGIRDNGLYPVAVRAIDDRGAQGVARATLQVSNAAPTLAASGALNVALGSPWRVDFSATDPGDDAITGWLVRWGDGTQETLGASSTSATHVFSTPGLKTVEIQAFDEDSGSLNPAATRTQLVSVIVQASSLNLGGPYTLAEGESLVLAGSAPGSPVLSWSINGQPFGAAGASGATPVIPWATLQSSFGVNNQGSFSLQLRATYGTTVVTSSAGSFTVSNTAPTLSSFTASPSNVLQGGSASVTFAAADPAAGDTLRYSVDFGDDGSFEVTNASTPIIAVPQSLLLNSGELRIRGTVSDGTASVGALTTITVGDVPPTLVATGASTVDEGADYRLQLSANDFGSDAVLRWRIDWGDGQTQVVQGASVDTTHRYADNGSYVISYEASDARGTHAAPVGKAVTAQNRAPSLTLVSESSVAEGQLAGIRVQFSDAGLLDSHTLTLDWGDGSAPEVLLLPAGSQPFTLQHRYAQDGSYTVSATLLDDDGGSAAASATQQVTNVAPTVESVELLAARIVEGGLFTLTGRVADAGVADLLQVSIDWGDGSASSMAKVDPLTGSFSATHVYLDDVPTGTAADALTLSVTVRDEAGASGSASRQLTVDNVAPKLVDLQLAEQRDATRSVATLSGSLADAGELDSHTLVIEWGDGQRQTLLFAAGERRSFSVQHEYDIATVPGYRLTLSYADDDLGEGVVTLDTQGYTPNRAPVAGDDAFVVEAGRGSSLLVLSNDSDPDRDTLQPYAVTLPQHGELSLVPGSRGVFFYTPAPGYSGSDSFSYRVSDGELRSNIAKVTITVLAPNRAPVLEPIADRQVNEGETVVIPLAASDADGDPLSFSIVSGLGRISNTGVYSYTPADGDALLPVTLRVEDGRGGSAERSFNLEVRNVAPTLNVSVPAPAVGGAPVELQFSASDPGTDTITEWIVKWGDGSTITLPGSARSASHTYGLPGGSFTVQVSARDEDGITHAAPLPLVVAPATLRVLATQPTASGVRLVFNQPVDTSTIAQFGGALRSNDFSLRGTASGLVNGSLVFASDGLSAEFVRTGAALPSDRYTLTLASGADAFRAAGSGVLLDGNRDGTPGDDFSLSFDLVRASTVSVSMPDFMRGPGQAVDVPATAAGLPITYSGSGGQRTLDITVGFNPALLQIQGATVDAGLPAGTTVDVQTLASTENRNTVRISLTLPAGQTLPAGSARLMTLQASVPASAPYGATQVLDVNLSAIDGVPQSVVMNPADDAVHVVGWFGDTSGNARYGNDDVTLLQRVIVRSDAGFAAWANVDPTIVGDIAGGGSLNSIDAGRLLQEVNFLAGAAGSVNRPEIPAIPAGFVPPLAAEPPQRSALAVRAGEVVDVAVPMPQMPPGAAGALRVQVAFDGSRYALEGVQGGALADGVQWHVAEQHSGGMAIDVRGLVTGASVAPSGTPGAAAALGSLLDLRWRVREGALPGLAPIEVRFAPLPEGPVPQVVLGERAAVLGAGGTGWAEAARPRAPAWLRELADSGTAETRPRLPEFRVTLAGD